MALRGIRQVRIHDIDRLVEIVEKDGVELPVDRDFTVTLVDKVGRWAEAQIAEELA